MGAGEPCWGASGCLGDVELVRGWLGGEEGGCDQSDTLECTSKGSASVIIIDDLTLMSWWHMLVSLLVSG